ncbi:hypothetical protein QBC32DRAFT_35586 [Pseudoneurospora amorphoporcata]|uniref:Uncharacterized protein n=1 Tax=Pseudoneurospora amorphoporcata TaxID=241081 RepID=A0AAN6NP61_9PEZI|nr:hypothetical protein QBC32DRAFT_35586 [Pseudoneurospora amorphoporcata]
MRPRLRSSVQRPLKRKRHGNAEDREGSMDQEQSRPAPLLELPTSIQHISATTSTSSFSLPASLPLPAAPAISFTDVETSASQLPLAPATGFTNVETSTPRPPATPTTSSADTETSAGVDNTKQVGSLLFPLQHFRMMLTPPL